MTFLFFLVTAGCSGSDDTAKAVLPEDTTPITPADSGTPFFAVDTSGMDSGFNENPGLLLDIVHEGEWSLNPVGGPYLNFSGTMSVLEVINGEEDPAWCTMTFSLTGFATENKCDTCDVAFDVEFYLLENEDEEQGPPPEDMMDEEPTQAYVLEDCLTPDMPRHEEVRRLGFSAAEGTIYFDYYNSGFWLPWYDAYQIHDDIFIKWEERMGFFGFPDD